MKETRNDQRWKKNMNSVVEFCYEEGLYSTSGESLGEGVMVRPGLKFVSTMKNVVS